jgi:hypothetical protein
VRIGGRIGATLLQLGQALGHVASEYRDLAREQEDEQQNFGVLLYLAPLTRRESEALRLRIVQNERVERTADRVPAAVPPRHLLLMVEVPAPSGDAAVARVLDVVRSALHDEHLVLDRVHAEARTIDPGALMGEAATA